MAQRAYHHAHSFGDLVLAFGIGEAVVTAGAEVIFDVALLGAGGGDLGNSGQVVGMTLGALEDISAVLAGLRCCFRGGRSGIMV